MKVKPRKQRTLPDAVTVYFDPSEDEKLMRYIEKEAKESDRSFAAQLRVMLRCAHEVATSNG